MLLELDDASDAQHGALRRELERRGWKSIGELPETWREPTPDEATNVRRVREALDAAQARRWRVMFGFRGPLHRQLDGQSKRWSMPGTPWPTLTSTLGEMWDILRGRDREAPTRGEAEWIVGEGTIRSRECVVLHLDLGDAQRRAVDGEMHSRGWFARSGLRTSGSITSRACAARAEGSARECSER